jgi:hypothetical protein
MLPSVAYLSRCPMARRVTAAWGWLEEGMIINATFVNTAICFWRMMMIYDVMCVCVCVCVCVGVEGVLSAEKISHIFAQPQFSHNSATIQPCFSTCVSCGAPRAELVAPLWLLMLQPAFLSFAIELTMFVPAQFRSSSHTPRYGLHQ